VKNGTDVARLNDAIVRAERERDVVAARLQQAEEDLDAANQRLEHADSARRQLLDNVASGGDEARRRFATALHDGALQLLTAAELQLERIRGDARKSKLATDLDELQNTINHVEDSLRSLLFNVSPAAIDLHVRLADSIRDRAMVLKQHSGIEAELDLRLPDDVSDSVKANVFRNVSEALSNVEKHSNATRVGVRAAMVDDGVSVVISDDGTGFVVAEGLYLPGHLGLVAMRERAQLAGGWCRLDSEPGTGTRISFWIPAGGASSLGSNEQDRRVPQADSLSTRGRSASETAGAARPAANILVVDDDPAKLVELRGVLEPLGENVVEARSGADALRFLLKQDFAVILLDVRLPVMSGFETAEMIRQRPASELTPIIFVTAMASPETDMGRDYELRAVDYVFSPIQPAILRAKVSVFVELYKGQQELKRYRAQLQGLVQERTAALTAINRELEAFGYFVSHNLRTPLMAMDKMAQSLLDNSATTDGARELVERMRRTSKQMISLFDGMQTLLRLTSGDIRRERIDVKHMAEEIVANLRAGDPQRQVEVNIEPGLTVNGDAGLVRILLANLINNAWKFNRPKADAKIRIGSETVTGEKRIFVRDNGVGFDMIYAHKLFGAFQRLHSQSEFSGDGIGLAAAQRIVNRHGGRIWAEGAMGEGATFYFVL